MRIAEKLDHFPIIQKYYLKLATFYDNVLHPIPLKTLVRLHKKSQKKLIFVVYPEMPRFAFNIRQFCALNGYTITTDLAKANNADFLFYHEDQTIRIPDRALQDVSKKIHVINIKSLDISKKIVDLFHKKIFGYSLAINPATYKGSYVKKVDANGLHKGWVLHKPTKPQKGYVYQRLVDTEINEQVTDIRVPVFIDTIPFAYIKQRPARLRFEARNDKATVVKNIFSIISRDEYNKIIRLCQALGVEYAEVDLLRDRHLKKLYVVDVNNTPGGPTSCLPLREYMPALEEMTNLFVKKFVLKHN